MVCHVHSWLRWSAVRGVWECELLKKICVSEINCLALESALSLFVFKVAQTKCLFIYGKATVAIAAEAIDLNEHTTNCVRNWCCQKWPSIFWGPPIKEQKVPSLLQTSASTAAPKLPTAPKILFIIISILSETTTQHFHFICSRDHDRVLLDKNIKLIYETTLQSVVNDQTQSAKVLPPSCITLIEWKIPLY